ncbi:hypothetical protein N7520_010561 [Penicillium odoratum]|uniref:uncharacterized protein n=1 Tax=Penicillium odoratum TaxID=1167516 RepID=UPI0025493873|nr:uncharacterized protein N7520_010561 [Penicillium odoratum]KAJ5745379.1 hypothetical protein N7520_010561 [Penicillium odoratum]
MYASSAIRARLANVAVRRGFSTTRAQFGSPYHYAEGPRTNIPFNPLTKHFFWRYWAFMSSSHITPRPQTHNTNVEPPLAVGFGAPFAIAVWQTYKTK